MSLSDPAEQGGGEFGVFGGVLVGVVGQGVDPGEVHFGPAFPGQEGAAGDGDDGAGSGAPGDGGGQLAGQGLFVEAAFAGDDDVAGVLAGVEVQQVQEVVGAGDLLCPEQQAGVAESAGAAGAVVLGEPGGVGASRRRQPGDEMFEALVEGGDLLGSGALLRAEDRRCAPGAEQRVVDVAGDDRARCRPGPGGRSVRWCGSVPASRRCRGAGGRRRRGSCSRGR